MVEEHPTPKADVETLGERHLCFWKENLDEPCFVYVLRGEPAIPIKIGVARDVAARIKTLQTGYPYPLRPIYVLPVDTSRAHDLEWQLHQKLKKSRLTGEWFGGEAVAPFLAFVAELSQKLVDAYDGSCNPPWYRQFGSWKYNKASVAFDPNAPSSRAPMPPPVPPEEAEARVRAHYLRRSEPGVYWDQDGKRQYQENIS